MKRDNSYLVGNQFAKGSGPNSGSFKKGLIPWNKGMKGVHFSPDTEFKKGQKSNKRVPVGTITIRIDKNGTKRRWIKADEPSKWVMYANHVWLCNGNEIPEGYFLHHIDGNSLNESIDNLCLVDRAMHVNLHREKLVKSRKVKRIENDQPLFAGID
jgi:hypothetical protein